MVDLTNLLIRQIADLDSDIDTSEGSNFRDLLINPVSSLFSRYQNEHDRIVNNLSLKDPVSLTEDELDAIGANFLVTRVEGAYHTGTIKLYFGEPVSLNLPAGTTFIFDSSGYEYETTSSYTGTKFAMNQTLDVDGYYSSAAIGVRSVLKTADGALSATTRLSIKNSISPTPQRVQVETSITGGSARENNSTYYNRIISSVKTSTLASETVISENVKIQNTAIKDVKVIGAGDVLMKRDLLAYNSLTPNTVENYEYVFSGENDSEYSKGHQAFIDNFSQSTVSGENPNIVFPALTEWETEFTNEQYKAIIKLDDALKASQDQYQLVTINNWTETRLNQFLRNDGSRVDNLLVWPDEIRVSGTSAILGRSPSGQDSEQQINVTFDQIQNVLTEIEEANTQEIVEKEFSLSGVILTLQNILGEEQVANLAPILHKSINKHTGIEIETTMQTSDGSALGEMAYITVLRNDTVFMANDGYGLAWRKQPGFLTRLNSDSYNGNTELKNQDIETFKSHFNGTDPVSEGLIGSNAIKNDDTYWFYNAYLVDNNTLDEEIIIGANKVFDASNGINQYVQRAKYWIEKDTDYDFKIEIKENLATKIWVRPSTEETYDLILNKGATFPSYVPSAGETLSTGNVNVDALDSTRGNFGIGVGQTKGYEWTVKSVFVRTIAEVFPMHLFKFKIDTDKWSSNAAAFSVDYYGVGYDPSQYAADSNTGNSRTQAAIWNATDTQWELLGTHIKTIDDSPENWKISDDLSALNTYMDEDNFIYVAASAANFGTSFSNNTDHSLLTYYIQLSNPEAGQYHLGNSIDVYCHAPTEVVEKAANYTVANGQVILNEPYVQDIIEIRETLSQVAFPTTDYTIFNQNAGESFGKDNSIKIAFDSEDDGTQITVIYRGWDNGSTINAYLNDPDNRYPAVSIKEKIMPPAIVSISSLEYSGNLDLNVAKEKLTTFINSITNGELQKSDLINVLSNAGATSVSTSITLTIKQYTSDFSNTTYNLTGDTYQLPSSDISRFFATSETLNGVTIV